MGNGPSNIKQSAFAFETLMNVNYKHFEKMGKILGVATTNACKTKETKDVAVKELKEKLGIRIFLQKSQRVKTVNSLNKDDKEKSDDKEKDKSEDKDKKKDKKKEGKSTKEGKGTKEDKNKPDKPQNGNPNAPVADDHYIAFTSIKDTIKQFVSDFNSLAKTEVMTQVPAILDCFIKFYPREKAIFTDFSNYLKAISNTSTIEKTVHAICDYKDFKLGIKFAAKANSEKKDKHLKFENLGRAIGFYIKASTKK